MYIFVEGYLINKFDLIFLSWGLTCIGKQTCILNVAVDAMSTATTTIHASNRPIYLSAERLYLSVVT